MVFASLLVLCMLIKECVVKENYFCVRITALHALWYWLQTTGVQSRLPPSPRLPAAFASPSQTQVPAAPGGGGWNKGQGMSRRSPSLSPGLPHMREKPRPHDAALSVFSGPVSPCPDQIFPRPPPSTPFLVH